MSLAIVFAWVAYRALWARDEALARESTEAVPIIHVTGGTGGHGFNAGGGGGVAGPGGYAEGGQGGGGYSLLEALAFSTLGTGLPLDYIVTQAGYTPDSPELRQRFGAGGGGGGAGIQPGTEDTDPHA
jgi:hypothetical protein